MTRLELVFTILAEESIAEFTEVHDAQAYQDMEDCAKLEGGFAGQPRLQLEAQTGSKVVSKLYQIPTTTE